MIKFTESLSFFQNQCEMSKAKKTRNSSGSKLSDYLGVGKEFIPTEVPTLRGAIRKVLFEQEKFVLQGDGDLRNLPLKDVMTLVAQDVLNQWLKANHQFTQPVVISKKSLVDRQE